VRGELKKLTSIILIFLFVFDSCGYFFVYYELSNYFKQEGFSKICDFISDNEMEILAFHIYDSVKEDSPLQILDKSEIKFNGILYDVCKKVSEGDSVFFYCVNDKNENILEKVFSLYIENKTQENSKNIPIRNILHNIIKIAIAPVLYNNIYFRNSFTYFTFFIDLIPQHSIDIPTPPPKCYS